MPDRTMTLERLRSSRSVRKDSMEMQDQLKELPGQIKALSEQLPFWNDLSDRERETVRRSANLRRYPAGSIIHSRDRACLGLIRVLSGRVRSFMLSEEGREITLYQLKKGDLDVLSAACVVSQITFETQLVAETDCEILIVPASCLSGLKERNLAVRCFIFEKLGERFSDVMKVMQNMLFTRIDHRIAADLLALAGGRDEVRTTHEAIASRINSSREVVSRALKEMEQDGLIGLGRGKIRIRDRNALMDI